MPAPRLPEPDLFAAAAAEEARLVVEAAEQRRLEALRSVRLAPIGETTTRRQRAIEATAAALAAEILAAKSGSC
jgi:hypothetical protein